ncbi:MAG: SMC-Scp complex subunit ScpB [Proteobacteria bacterium]|nr:SMC-Scp complex subunit ScpB [Pseudomonadota bacterium]
MSDVDNKVKMIVEGLLLAAGRPLTLDNIAQVFSEDEKPDHDELKFVMQTIAEACDDRGFELKEIASGYRFQVKQELSEWVAKLWEEKPPRYSRALLETLALIAYRQPITRGDIEEIRGVGVSSNIIRTLLDREWIRVVGHRDVPGRPAMFATSKQFLDYFNLKSLQELPALSEIKDLDKVNQELDLEDEMLSQRVLELPEDVVDENSFQETEDLRAELLAEEAAAELSKKPLDEILGLIPAQDAVENEEAAAKLRSDKPTASNQDIFEEEGPKSEQLASDDLKSDLEVEGLSLGFEENLTEDAADDDQDGEVDSGTMEFIIDHDADESAR